MARIKHNEENDYTLLGVDGPVWITVGNLAVYLRPFADSLEVEVYRRGGEMGASKLGGRVPQPRRASRTGV